MSRTTITITIHDRYDPRCVKFGGVRAPWPLRWFYRCDECRAVVRPDEQARS
jgi:hypothetical protein